MKKHIKIILIILGTFLVLLLGLYSFLFGNQASSPDSIARKVGLRLPAYEITKAEDNMDRTASAWSDYYYEIQFKKPLSEKFIRKVEKQKNCTREGETLIVSDESPDSWSGKVYIYSKENRATLRISAMTTQAFRR